MPLGTISGTEFQIHCLRAKVLGAEPRLCTDGCRWERGDQGCWMFLSPESQTILAKVDAEISNNIVENKLYTTLTVDLCNGAPAQKWKGATLTEVMHNAEFQARIAHAILIRDERHTAVSG